MPPQTPRRWASRLVVTIMVTCHLSLLASSAAADEQTNVALPEHRQHPFLFGGPELYVRAQKRAETYPWAKKVYDRILRDAEAMLGEQVDIPTEGGQWSHHYVCKQCGSKLRHKTGTHACPRCGRGYSGWPYDQVIYTHIHNRNLRHVLPTLGLAYTFTGRKEYAERARKILLEYAGRYAGYALHGKHGRLSIGRARLFAQTLDEAVAAIPLAWAYDLTYPSLSPADRRAIEQGLLRGMVRTIQGNWRGRSNWQTWHNAAVAVIGFCLQDQKLVDEAVLDPRNGVLFQLRNSVMDDGFWYEGSVAYHFYALRPLEWTARAASFAGLTLHQHPRLQSMYAAPIQYASPTHHFPAISDSDPLSLAGRAAHYEVAYAWFGDRRFLPVARGGKRTSRDILLWGLDSLPEAPPPSFSSKDFPGLGAVVLRTGEGREALYVHLDYNTLDHGHGHADKLAIVLYGLGHRLAPDAARLAYGAPLQRKWYRQTVAHNTVCVDRRSHGRARGRLLFFLEKPGIALARAECNDAYKGVRMRRTVALTERYLIDIFQTSSDRERVFDWVHHNLGQLQPGLASSPPSEPPGKCDGYSHIEKLQVADTDQLWHVDFRQPDVGVRLTMSGARDTTVWFGEGLLDNPPRPCPLVLVRRKGKTATFLSVIEPYATAPKVKGIRPLTVTGGEALAVEISHDCGRDLLMIAEPTGGKRTFADITTEKRIFFRSEMPKRRREATF
ncbi:heparinase II/III family protein [Planctomycetota bacterium]